MITMEHLRGADSFTQPRIPQYLKYGHVLNLRLRQRHVPPACEVPAGVVVTVLSGAAILLRPESSLWDLLKPTSSFQLEEFDGLTNDSGWIVSIDFASPPEPRGVVTKLLYGERREESRRRKSRQQTLELLLRFSIDQRRMNAIGEVGGNLALQRPSRYLAQEGAWAATERNVPTSSANRVRALQWQMATIAPLPLVDGLGELPRGATLYFDAVLDVDEARAKVAALVQGSPMGEGMPGPHAGLTMREGRVRVQELSQLALTLGVAELQTIGTFSARPLPPKQQSQSQPAAASQIGLD